MYFSCSEKEAIILRDLVFDIAKKSKDYNGYYTSTPSVIFDINEQILIDNIGLFYSFYNER